MDNYQNGKNLFNTTSSFVICKENVSRFDFSPYCEVIRSVESGDLVTLTYTGQEVDKDLGVMNYNARLYDPVLSRFLSVDPLRQFHSPYNYVGNNPFSFIDPSGMNGTPGTGPGTDPNGGEGVIGGGGRQAALSSYADQMFGSYSASRGFGPMTTSAGDAVNVNIQKGMQTQSEQMEEAFDRAIYTHTVTSTVETDKVISEYSVPLTGDQTDPLSPYFYDYIVNYETLTYSNTRYSPEPKLENRWEDAASLITGIISGMGNLASAEAAYREDLLAKGFHSTKAGDIVRVTNPAGVRNTISNLSNFGRAATIIGLAPTAYSQLSAAFDGTYNTSNLVDLTITGGLVIVGAFVTGPVAVVGIVGAGIVYGGIRMVHGEAIDNTINRNFGWR